MIYPQPSAAARPLRWRRWNHLRAIIGAYFWIPCPLCGQMFGGHEASDLAVHDNPDQPWRGKIVCQGHDPVWPEGVGP